MSARVLGTLIALALTTAMATGCGNPEEGPAATGLPTVEVVDLATRAPVSLPDAPEGGKPLLIWFWSPY